MKRPADAVWLDRRRRAYDDLVARFTGERSRRPASPSGDRLAAALKAAGATWPPTCAAGGGAVLDQERMADYMPWPVNCARLASPPRSTRTSACAADEVRDRGFARRVIIGGDEFAAGTVT